MRLLALLLVGAAVAAQDPVDLAGWLNRGVQEFKAARYPEAVAAFERAAAIDPSNVAAQLYLGTAYMQQFIPRVRRGVSGEPADCGDGPGAFPACAGSGTIE